MSIRELKSVDNLERLPPHSPEAESCLLASMMLDKLIADEVIGAIGPGAFYLEEHAILFRAIKSLRGRGSNVDAVILRDELRSAGKLDDIGGAVEIARILSAVPSTAHWQDYLVSVREKMLYRDAITIGERMIRDAYAQEQEPVQLLTHATTSIARRVSDVADDEVMSADQLFGGTCEQLANPEQAETFVSYGFPSIDAALTGIAPGELILLGARPSMGKSTLQRQVAVLAAMSGTPVLYFSLEESDRKVARNIFSWRCSIENRRMRAGNLDLPAVERVKHEAQSLRKLPLWFVRGQSNADRIHTITANAVAKHGVRLVMIDYLQLIDAGGRGDFERATNSSNAVRRIARELNVGTFCAAQLSRDTAKREDKRPTMTDIRSSGQIEQDADVILLLHREDYYHTEDPAYEPTRKAELIQAKVRDGERGGAIELRSNLAFQCFQEIADRPLIDQDKINF